MFYIGVVVVICFAVLGITALRYYPKQCAWLAVFILSAMAGIWLVGRNNNEGVNVTEQLRTQGREEELERQRNMTEQDRQREREQMAREMGLPEWEQKRLQELERSERELKRIEQKLKQIQQDK